jgi:hypothetical protein
MLVPQASAPGGRLSAGRFTVSFKGSNELSLIS